MVRYFFEKGNIMGIMDTRPAKGQSGEREPKGVAKADTSGERKEKIRGGVGMGKMDSLGSRPLSHAGNFEGRLGECNDGNMGEREVYSHKRTPHAQDGK